MPCDDANTIWSHDNTSEIWWLALQRKSYLILRIRQYTHILYTLSWAKHYQKVGSLRILIKKSFRMPYKNETMKFVWIQDMSFISRSIRAMQNDSLNVPDTEI